MIINKSDQTLYIQRKYIRETLSKTDFIVPPSIDYRYFINAFNRIDNNLNQLVKQTHPTNNIHEDQRRYSRPFESTAYESYPAISF